MTRYLTPYGQEQRDRARRAGLLLPFAALGVAATLIVFWIAALICPDPPRERGYRYREPR